MGFFWIFSLMFSAEKSGLNPIKSIDLINPTLDYSIHETQDTEQAH